VKIITKLPAQTLLSDAMQTILFGSNFATAYIEWSTVHRRKRRGATPSKLASYSGELKYLGKPEDEDIFREITLILW